MSYRRTIRFKSYKDKKTQEYVEVEPLFDDEEAGQYLKDKRKAFPLYFDIIKTWEKIPGAESEFGQFFFRLRDYAINFERYQYPDDKWFMQSLYDIACNAIDREADKYLDEVSRKIKGGQNSAKSRAKKKEQQEPNVREESKPHDTMEEPQKGEGQRKEPEVKPETLPEDFWDEADQQEKLEPLMILNACCESFAHEHNLPSPALAMRYVMREYAKQHNKLIPSDVVCNVASSNYGMLKDKPLNVVYVFLSLEKFRDETDENTLDALMFEHLRKCKR